ncbi:MAG TPA: aspartyl-phosphate phosphatase Spo0E family protein [Bacillus bacterium]|nr:aspartyl-phosphate phosphatase Spo0E family protein [Bacillus sp. (in: firmicutes)]
MREIMIASAKETGYTSEETIRSSQELDRLIYEYQTLCKEIALKKQRGRLLFKKLILLTKTQHYYAGA